MQPTSERTRVPPQKGDQEEQALGRSKGGFTSKIHAVVDARGNPLKFILTDGHGNDVTQAVELLEGWETTRVIADKAMTRNRCWIKSQRWGWRQ
jgi:IS5 family transposase